MVPIIAHLLLVDAVLALAIETALPFVPVMQELLENKGECMFTDLITRRGNELDVICAFMAILDAVKRKMADIYQNKMFGDIKICRKMQAA